MTSPDPQDPDSVLYDFVDTQPLDAYPASPDSSQSHFTTRQFTPESITNTLPIIVTKTAHGLANGQAIRATQFISMPFARSTGMQQLNNRLFYIQQATIDTFILCDANRVYIDGRGFTPYIAGGQFTVTGPYITVNPSAFPPPGILIS